MLPGVRRLARLAPHLAPQLSNAALVRTKATGTAAATVRIGETVVPLTDPLVPELVPRPSATRGVEWVDSESELEALQWLMKKQQLGQDVFLLGPPGPHLRQLAFRFCELTQREVPTHPAAVHSPPAAFLQLEMIRHPRACR